MKLTFKGSWPSKYHGNCPNFTLKEPYFCILGTLPIECVPHPYIYQDMGRFSLFKKPGITTEALLLARSELLGLGF